MTTCQTLRWIGQAPMLAGCLILSSSVFTLPCPAENPEPTNQTVNPNVPTDGPVTPLTHGVRIPDTLPPDITSILLRHCTVCHGRQRQEGNLDLRTAEAIFKGGKSGPVLVPGHPEQSLLVNKIRSGSMPPKEHLLNTGTRPVKTSDRKRMVQWIANGAPAADTSALLTVRESDATDRQFWAFQPPLKSSSPLPDGYQGNPESDHVRNPIDAFILSKLHQQERSFAPEADRLTLIRRAYLDLIGLPPTPEAVQAFLADSQEDAYEQLIDRLLASPGYGERWARHWLDTVGYADSWGGKLNADHLRPHAWRYRDYVIHAFNDDKPYDRFLLEQIAGDELVDYENAEIITDAIYDNLVATGFLRMGPDSTSEREVSFISDRFEVIADEIDIFSTTVLGLTLKCARCHDHKYDPIAQQDYYSMIALFKGAYDEYDWLKPVSGSEKKYLFNLRLLPFVTTRERDAWKKHNHAIDKQISKLKQQDNPDESDLKALEQKRLPEPHIQALWDRGTPSPTYLYRRGESDNPGHQVKPGIPAVLSNPASPFVIKPPWPGARQTGRRLALAKWVTHPDHPLTARVLVNRIWKHHFGKAIVSTLGNFGITGARPTHPKLLDWLARELIDHGWSIKHLHRQMMTSTTYRQTSQHNHLSDIPDTPKANNETFSPMPRKRMEAEVLRDSLLFVAGQLNYQPHGPPDSVKTRNDGLVMSVSGSKGWRRSIYIRQRRNEIPTILETFDLPRMNPNCVTRPESTVASQALHLMNNAMIDQLATDFAQRVLHSSAPDVESRVSQIYWIALSRPPTDEEVLLGKKALRSLEDLWRQNLSEADSAHPDKARHQALSTYCHVILNSAAFLYID